MGKRLSLISGEVRNVEGLEEGSPKDIAVVGISINFPQARSLAQFWDNLVSGVDSVRHAPNGRRAEAAFDLHNYGDRSVPGRLARIGYLDNISEFDPAFFKISPREAKLMDPHQRLFLQCAWEAVEDSGYGGGKLNGTNTGVYIGYNPDTLVDYKQLVNHFEPEASSMAVPGNLSSIIANRVSYLLNLHGPSMYVNTGCSSSMVALHLACQGLLSGDCDFAISGGVRLSISPRENSYKVGAADDGKAKTFDDRANGTSEGEGVAAVLLRPLRDAWKSRDPIYAVIKASAINQDGVTIGLTAPNAEAQSAVIRKAWRSAHIDPETIGYIEAHGSGTQLGDPIEVAGIQDAFSHYTNRKQFCGVGSVKTNIGHIDSVAGMAGFIKSILAIQKGIIPPTLHFERPNREIKFHESPIYIADQQRPWSNFNAPRRGGVSSFGIGGTNCHVVLEEAPAYPERRRITEEKYYILPLSAMNETALQRQLRRYLSWLEENQEERLQDICFTASTARGHYRYRAAIIADTVQEAIRKISSILSELSEAKGVYLGTGHEQANHALDNVEKDEINHLIDSFRKSGLEGFPIAERLCSLYVHGGDIPWELLFKEEAARLLHLPAYVFDTQKYWVADAGSKNSSTFYQMKWKRLDPGADHSSLQMLADTVLIIKGREGRQAERLAALLRVEGCSVLEAEIGDSFAQMDGGRFTVGSRQKDYDRLAAEAKIRNVTHVYHLTGFDTAERVESVAGFQQAQEQGVDSLFYLAKALVHAKLPGTIELVMAGRSAYAVTGDEERLHPENAALYGLGRVVEQEYGNIRCRAIDVDERMTEEELLAELRAEAPAYITAVRNGERYVEAVGEVEEFKREGITIHENGVYLVTGGTGGMGLEIAKYLASRARILLVLLNRSGFPARDQWHVMLERGEDTGLCGKISALQAIERTGSRVYCYRADIGDEERLHTVLNQVRTKHGPIRGIVHSAGVAGDGFLLNKEKKVFDEVVDPKMRGTWLLDRLTEEDKPDFMVLFSSISALVGAHGQGDYTAANAYLDAYTDYRNRQGKRTLTINWATWKETGMAVGFGKNHDQVFRALRTEEAIVAFDLILHSVIRRVIIGELDVMEIAKLGALPIQLSDGIKEMLRQASSQSNGIAIEQTAAAAAVSSEVRLSGKADESYTETERALAQIWSEVFGNNEINIQSNFYEIGGDSIFAMRMSHLIQSRLNRDVLIPDILTYSTISKLADYMEARETKSEMKSSLTDVPELVDHQKSCIYPVTSMQKGLFALSQLEDSTVYNMTMVLKISGELVAWKLEAALQEVIRRHSALRTSFLLDDGDVAQMVHRQVELHCPVLKVASGDLDNMLNSLIAPFRLEQSPLLRAFLLEQSRSEHYLLLDMPHIISDGYSIAIFLTELFGYYEGYLMEPLDAQFVDYATWQLEWIGGEEYRIQEQFWLNQMAGAMPKVNLPYDFADQGITGFQGSSFKFQAGSELTLKVRAMAQKMNCTLYMVLMAAFQILLQKYANQDDIVVGFTINCRSTSAFGKVIGPFVNTLPIRGRPEADKQIRVFVEEMRQIALEAYANHKYPMEHLSESLRSNSRDGYRSFINIEYTHHVTHIYNNDFGTLKVEPYPLHIKTAKFDLALQTVDDRDSIQFDFEYNTSIFTNTSIQRFAEDLLAILQQVCDRLEECIGDIELQYNEAVCSKSLIPDDIGFDL